MIGSSIQPVCAVCRAEVGWGARGASREACCPIQDPVEERANGSLAAFAAQTYRSWRVQKSIEERQLPYLTVIENVWFIHIIRRYRF